MMMQSREDDDAKSRRRRDRKKQRLTLWLWEDADFYDDSLLKFPGNDEFPKIYSLLSSIHYYGFSRFEREV